VALLLLGVALKVSLLPAEAAQPASGSIGVELVHVPAGSFVMGQKIGAETLYRPDGSVEWQRQYRPDGSHVWTQYWESGQKKAQSAWRNLHAEGPAKLWDRTGKLISDVTFTAGTIRPNKQTP
jgi:hypothetical protein